MFLVLLLRVLGFFISCGFQWKWLSLEILKIQFNVKALISVKTLSDQKWLEAKISSDSQFHWKSQELKKSISFRSMEGTIK